MNSSLLHVVALAVGLAVAAPAFAAAAPAKVAKVATVNGVAIPNAYVDVVVNAQVQQGASDSEELRASITDRLVELEVLAQAARKKKLDKSPELKAQLEVARMQALASAYVQDYAKNHPVSDEIAKAEYDRLRAKSGDKDYKARHILVDTEDEAKDIIAKLKKGEKFEDLAKASKDAGTKDKGGELDWTTADSYVQPFSDALVKLDKGQYTDTPVHTQFGWHVIRLDDTRPAQYPEFDEVKDQLKQSLQQPELQKMVKAMRDKAKIEMH
jgi:peptidyl-prolyl cis-trans isomerase C